jgi:hypothetical protein
MVYKEGVLKFKCPSPRADTGYSLAHGLEKIKL